MLSPSVPSHHNGPLHQENPSFRAIFPRPIVDAVVDLLPPPLSVLAQVVEPLFTAACGGFRVGEERGCKRAAWRACTEAVVILSTSSSTSSDNRCPCAAIVAVAPSDVKGAHAVQAICMSLLSCLIAAHACVGLCAAAAACNCACVFHNHCYSSKALIARNAIPRLSAFLPILWGFMASIERSGV